MVRLIALVVFMVYSFTLGSMLSFWACHKKVGRQITHKYDYLVGLATLMVIALVSVVLFLFLRGMI